MLTFRPILAGATLKGRAVACVGALFGIGLTGLSSRWLLGSDDPMAALMIASMGASAVLMFAVPASPLAQPWPSFAGHVVSAMVGVVVVHLVPDPVIGAAIAVAAAIAAMSICRCLHPPGGGTALIPVLAGLGEPASAWHFPLEPVALNALILVGAAWAFHRISGHAYPHRIEAIASGRLTITDGDIDHALAQLHEPLDVNRDDLRVVASLAVDHAARRTGQP